MNICKHRMAEMGRQDGHPVSFAVQEGGRHPRGAVRGFEVARWVKEGDNATSALSPPVGDGHGKA